MPLALPRSLHPPSVRLRRRGARLAPLLLAVALGQAHAVELRLTGADGAPGVHGTVAFEAGGQGGGAPDLTYTLESATEDRVGLALYGGAGGLGGRGGPEFLSGPDPVLNQGGVGGNGGVGGSVHGSVGASLRGGAVLASATAYGGKGGAGNAPGCCFTYSGPGGAGGRGGDATSFARGETPGAGATVRALAVAGDGGDGYIGAFGGGGGDDAHGGNGGDALASGSGWSAAGPASGSATARGGAGGAISPQSLWSRGGAGGGANASLTLRAAGMATGEALAIGGDGVGAYGMFPAAGSGVASLTLSGAGASGHSVANSGAGVGGAAASTLRAVTSGALAVDVGARAGGVANASASADVYVDSGYGAAPAGTAAVRGRAFAGGGGGGDGTLSSATVNLFGSGGIVGVSDARGGDAAGGDCYYGCVRGGAAFSGASGITSGRHDVTISAYARGGNAVSDSGLLMGGGSAAAAAYGKSAGGVVTVKAEALSQGYESDIGGARASAITTAAGGASLAEARYVAVPGTWNPDAAYVARADAASVGAGGARALASGQGLRGDLRADAAADGAVAVSGRAALTGFGDGLAESRASVGGAVAALGPFDGRMQALSQVTGAPPGADAAPPLAALAALAAPAGGASWRAVGAMAAAGGASAAEAVTQAGIAFNAGAGQHLLLGLFAPVPPAGNIFGLDFSVTNNGATLFARTFTGASELDLFFNSQLLDLGLLVAGRQQLLVSSVWHLGEGAGYGFHYALGASAVPEPGTWLLLVMGLGGVLLAARRKRHQPR